MGNDDEEILNRLTRLLAELLRVTRPRRFGEGPEAVVTSGDVIWLQEQVDLSRAATLEARTVETRATEQAQRRDADLESRRQRVLYRERIARAVAAGRTIEKAAQASRCTPDEARELLKEALAEPGFVEREIFSGAVAVVDWPARRARLTAIATGVEA